MKTLQEKKIEKMEEIIIHVGLNPEPSMTLIDALRNAQCKECNNYADTLATLDKEIAEQGEQRMSAEEILLKRCGIHQILLKGTVYEMIKVSDFLKYAEQYHQEQISDAVFTVVDNEGDLINIWRNKSDAENHAKELEKKHDRQFDVSEEPLF